MYGKQGMFPCKKNKECSLSGKKRNVPCVGNKEYSLYGKQGMSAEWKIRNVPCVENKECSLYGKQGIQSKEIKAKREEREEGIFRPPKLNFLGGPSLFLKGRLRKIIPKVFPDHSMHGTAPGAQPGAAASKERKERDFCSCSILPNPADPKDSLAGMEHSLGSENPH